MKNVFYLFIFKVHPKKKNTLQALKLASRISKPCLISQKPPGVIFQSDSFCGVFVLVCLFCVLSHWALWLWPWCLQLRLLLINGCQHRFYKLSSMSSLSITSGSTLSPALLVMKINIKAFVPHPTYSIAVPSMSINKLYFYCAISQ